MRIDFEEFRKRTDIDRGVLCVAPHPDDESAGTGGLLALCADAAIEVHVLVVTDGGASHPGSLSWPRTRLAARRREETAAALRSLGVRTTPIFLGLPDAGTPGLSPAADRDALGALTAWLDAFRPGLVLTTWRREPHCDHRYAYDLARRAAAGRDVRLAEYFVWTEMTGEPCDRPASHEGARVELDVRCVAARKREALGRHRSQLGLVVGDAPDGFVLDEASFAAMTGPTETYLL